jgi:hypothetical protein
MSDKSSIWTSVAIHARRSMGSSSWVYIQLSAIERHLQDMHAGRWKVHLGYVCIQLSAMERSAAMHAHRSVGSPYWVCILSISYGAVSCDACTPVDGKFILGIHTSSSEVAAREAVMHARQTC